MCNPHLYILLHIYVQAQCYMLLWQMNSTFGDFSNGACHGTKITTAETSKSNPNAETSESNPDKQLVTNASLQAKVVQVQCCLTPAEAVQTNRDGDPRTATSAFTQLLSSAPRFWLDSHLCFHTALELSPKVLVRQPPLLSHSS